MAAVIPARTPALAVHAGPRARAWLRERGLRPTLYLAGAGKAGLRGKAEALAQSLGLQEQVRFLGNVPDLPQRLAATQVFVLSSHEGDDGKQPKARVSRVDFSLR